MVKDSVISMIFWGGHFNIRKINLCWVFSVYPLVRTYIMYLMDVVIFLVEMLWLCILYMFFSLSTGCKSWTLWPGSCHSSSKTNLYCKLSCVFFLSVNQRLLIVGDNHYLQVCVMLYQTSFLFLLIIACELSIVQRSYL